jgi:hypothetical protein
MVVVVVFALRLIADWGFSSAGLLRSDADPFQEEKAAHIIDSISQSDPHGGSQDADCSDEQPRL